MSIIVPTLNEAGNLPLLLARIDAAMRQRSYEVVVVDDGSGDGTPAVCAQLSRDYPVTLHRREEARDGLSGAVLLGFTVARGDVLAVMDADLQHPPERLPDLIEPLLSGEADFVLGSRYVAGGRILEHWGAMRHLNSRVATWLARPVAGAVHDPMSGFFALRRETYKAAGQLNASGYKIGLELLCKCPIRRLREVPIDFGAREHGRSKLSLRQQMAYLAHLSRLYCFRFPRLARLLRFAGVVWRPRSAVVVRRPSVHSSPEGK